MAINAIMPGRLNYTHENYLNLLIVYGECNQILKFVERYSDKGKPLKNSDLRRKVQFCEFILTKNQDNIIWIDEAKFTKICLFNRNTFGVI